jgi:hypothetical protein
MNDRVATSLAPAAGFIAWSVAFVALYGLVSVGCLLGWQDVRWGPVSLLSALLAGLWIGAIAAAAFFVIASWRRMQAAGEEAVEASPFFRKLETAANGAALVSTIWIGLPILMASQCV